MEARAQATEGHAPRANYSLFLLTTIYTLNYADRGVMNLLLDPMKKDFRFTDTQMGLVTGFGFVVFYAILGVPAARWADKRNRINLLTAGLLVWSTLTVASGLVTSAGQLVIARLGIGAGEACCIAPSHSLLSDCFSKDARPRALAILSTGSEFGVMLGLLLSGWIGQYYGWRMAFIVAGIPGIFIAIVFRLTVKEPRRGSMERRPSNEGAPPLGETVRFLLTQKSYAFVTIGTSLMGLEVYDLLIWGPSLLRRVHHLSSAEIGTYAAVVRGFVAVLGVLLGGILTEKLGKRADVWRLFVPAIACVLSAPAMLLFVFVSSTALSLVGLGLSGLLIGGHFAPVYAICQTVSKVPMRAFASAFFLLFVNLIGLGVGSLLIGFLNDRFAPRYGAFAIRYSMAVPTVFGVLAGFTFWFGARYVKQDIGRVAAEAP